MVSITLKMKVLLIVVVLLGVFKLKLCLILPVLDDDILVRAVFHFQISPL